MSTIAVRVLLCFSVAAIPLLGAGAAGPTDAGTSISPDVGGNGPTVSAREINDLRAQIAEQEREIAKLQKAVSAQARLLDTAARAVSFRTVGDVGVAPLPASASGLVKPVQPVTRGSQEADAPAPLSLKIGNTYITPLGFMDLTYVNRSTNVGSGLGTSFGAIPFNTPRSAGGNLNDSLFSVQNSRLGARFDAVFRGTKVLGYWESDFLGYQPANVMVTSNPDTFRLRMFFVDLQKRQWEVLAGQAWSLMTPGRTGISPIPSNLFFTINADSNYQVGLTWARQGGVRVVWHPDAKIAWAFAAENPDQYIGGSCGGGMSALPSNLPLAMATQINGGVNNFATPGTVPDLITKVAFDPSAAAHIEFAGILSTAKTYNPESLQSFTTEAGGFEANSSVQVLKRLRLIENFTYGKGIGRYFLGQGPDIILYANGAPANVKSGGTVDGFEFQATKNSALYGYYGGVYYGRTTTIDPLTQKAAGYGYAGSLPGNNRTIQEATFGVQQTIWKDPRWGALQMYAQYSYVWRDPWWFASAQAPRQADTNMTYFALRYLLPGAPPALK